MYVLSCSRLKEVDGSWWNKINERSLGYQIIETQVNSMFPYWEFGNLILCHSIPLDHSSDFLITSIFHFVKVRSESSNFCIFMLVAVKYCQICNNILPSIMNIFFGLLFEYQMLPGEEILRVFITGRKQPPRHVFFFQISGLKKLVF